MTPVDLKAGRHALGLSLEGMRRLVGAMDRKHWGRTLQRWEDGDENPRPEYVAFLRVLLASPEARKAAGVPALVKEWPAGVAGRKSAV